jgi:hypothetical protein
MAQVPGFGNVFNADQFKAAIRSTMLMGMPEEPSERITFRWTPNRSYTSADSAGNPWSWEDVPVSEDAPEDVQVPAAVEFSARPAGSMDTPIGQFDTSRVIVTLLDDDFEQIRGADLIMIDGATYDVMFVGPPVGLFSVTVYSVFGEARDEA